MEALWLRIHAGFSRQDIAARWEGREGRYKNWLTLLPGILSASFSMHEQEQIDHLLACSLEMKGDISTKEAIRRNSVMIYTQVLNIGPCGRLKPSRTAQRITLLQRIN